MKLHDTILMGWDDYGELRYIRTFSQKDKKWKLDKAHHEVARSYRKVAMNHISYFSDVKVKEDDLSIERGKGISFPGRSFYQSSLGEIFNLNNAVLNQLDSSEKEKVLKYLAEMAAKELDKLKDNS